MPILLRFIAQRAFFLGLSVLTFLGVNPEVNVLTGEEAQIATEERKEVIQDTLDLIDEGSANVTPELDPGNLGTYIPLPKINIFNLPPRVPKTENITTPDAIKSQPPVIEPVPVKTTIPAPTPPVVSPKPTTSVVAPSPSPVVTPSPSPVAEPVASKVTPDTSSSSAV